MGSTACRAVLKQPVLAVASYRLVGQRRYARAL
jgi:hypothetical protein